jgi:putative ABC transport system permease protein
VYVRPPTSTAGESLVSIAPDKIAALRAYPGVIDLTTYRRLTVDATVIDGDWRPITLLAVGTERERPEDMFVWKEARAGGIWRSMQGRDEIEVSEPLANRLGLTPQNNRLRLRTPVGERAFTVVGVMYDYATDGGTVFIRRDQFEALWGDAGVSSLSMYLTPELATNTGKVAGDMRRSFAGLDLVFFANRELRQEALVIFDRTFSITSALNLLATLVAFIGVLSALMALQIERTRELGVLRANGMSLGQMARMTLLETGLLGGTAGLIALPTGFILAVILIYIINLRSFGWTIRMALDPGIFVQAMLVSIVSALLAAVYPMLRLRQLKIADAIRTE